MVTFPFTVQMFPWYLLCWKDPAVMLTAAVSKLNWQQCHTVCVTCVIGYLSVYCWHVFVPILRYFDIFLLPFVHFIYLSIYLFTCICMTFSKTDQVPYITPIIYDFYTIVFLLRQLRVLQINLLNEPFWECIIRSCNMNWQFFFLLSFYMFFLIPLLFVTLFIVRTYIYFYFIGKCLLLFYYINIKLTFYLVYFLFYSISYIRISLLLFILFRVYDIIIFIHNSTVYLLSYRWCWFTSSLSYFVLSSL